MINPDSLEYVLKRSNRKTIGLKITEEGLQVTAPLWATNDQVKHAMSARSAWILSKLKLWQLRTENRNKASEIWLSKRQIPYLGVYITVVSTGLSNNVVYHGNSVSPSAYDVLQVPEVSYTCAYQTKEYAKQWLKERALQLFDKRIQHFSSIAGVSPTSWGLSSASTTWGSCNSKKRILINWRLIHLEPRLIDYVIAHEISHLKQMNHSQLFWAHVKELMPDFAQARHDIRKHRPGSLPLV